MKSICVKTNHPKSIQYLLNKLDNLQIDNVYFSCKKFRNYQNIIIHFTGKKTAYFFQEISILLGNLIIEIFEKDLISKIIFSEYFYFDQDERIQILNNTIYDLQDSEECVYPKEKSFKLLCNDFYEYLKENKSILLKGFITFRIGNFIEILEEQVDKSVNKFLVQREYSEFIELLKMYVNTEKSSCNIVHLIYFDSKPVILDKDKNIIKIEENLFNAKYLSDITFSTNDYALNTLLTLIPKKIYIHLIDNNIDEFITTIKLIFENRVCYCTDCNICKMYRKRNALI